MKKNIYLIRHGESDENKFRILGDGTSPLSEKGRQEAEIIASRIQKLACDTLISSPFRRAKETAEAISVATGLPISFSETLVERKAPVSVHGRSMDEPDVKEAYRQIHAGYSDSDFRYEDAESFADLKNRAVEAIRFIIESGGENIAVVTHGLFMRVLIGEMLFQDAFTGFELMNLIHGLMTKNTGLTWCQYDEEFHLKPWRIMTWNDHNHLADTREG